jgi:hypothetical protein
MTKKNQLLHPYHFHCRFELVFKLNIGDKLPEILIQTAKYCLPQIKYLLFHVFLKIFRQGNVKLVLLKEFKPIILDELILIKD